jgi:hypothetical protein
MFIALTFILFFSFALLLIWLWTRKRDSPDESNPVSGFTYPPNNSSAFFSTAGVHTRIVFNGKEYSSREEMPAEVRQVYERTMATVLADADCDGVPDIFEAGSSSTIFHTDVLARALEDPAEKLKKLKEMLDSRLITQEEYEAKKTEILSRM